MTDLGALGWDGWHLGRSDDAPDRLRIVTGDPEAGAGPVTGFGTGRSLPEPSPRLAGGIHIGRATPQGRTIVVPLLQTRTRSKARRFAATMGPTEHLRPLTIAGLLWADDDDPNNPDLARTLVLYARPDGVDIPFDALAMGGPSVLHLRDATWVAPDPTLYDADATVETRSTPASAASIEWHNPGDTTPPPGLGGHAWTLEITAATTVRRPRVTAGDRTVTFRDVTLAPGQTLVIGPDRIPRIGTTYAVPWTGTSLAAQWPILPAGETSTLAIGCESGTFTARAEFRGTY